MFNYTVLLYHVAWPDDYLTYDVVTLYSTHMIPTCYYLTPDTWHLIYLTPVLDMLLLDTWYQTLDIWHRYLTCYHLTPDTWYLIYDTWQLTWYHLILDICYHLILIHLTWCCDTWLDIITPDTCITLHIQDYHYYGDLDMIIILLSDIWYSWTLVLLNSCIPCTHVSCTVTLVNSTVIPTSGRAYLVSGWWCIGKENAYSLNVLFLSTLHDVNQLLQSGISFWSFYL